MRLALPCALAWSAAALVLASAQAPAAPQRWRCARTAHFAFYSSTDSILETARSLERMADVISMWGLGSRDVVRRRVVVIGLPDKRSFEPHQPSVDGKKISTAGTATSGLEGHWIGFAEYDPRGRMVAHHEYAHTLLSDEFQKLPICLNEGLAEYLSTLRATRDGVEIGHPLPWYSYILSTEKPFSAEELFGVTNQELRRLRTTDRGRFYAESWALVYYLMSIGSGSRQLLPFAHDIVGGAAVRDAFQKHYPQEKWPDLVSRLRNFAMNEATTCKEIRVAGELDPATIGVREASPAEVETHVGLWRFWAEQDTAGTMALFRDALTDRPEMALAHAGQGLVALRAGQLERALGEFRTAAAGPNADALTLALAGRGMLGVASERSLTSGDPLLAEAESCFSRSLAADSTDLGARIGWEQCRSLRSQAGSGPPVESSVSDGSESRSQAPFDEAEWSRFESVAQRVERLRLAGDRAQASAVIDSALVTAGGEIRDRLTKMRALMQEWDRANSAVADYNAGAKAANSGAFEEATRLFERARDGSRDSTLKVEAQARIDDLAGRSEYELGLRAVRSNELRQALSWFRKAEAAARRPRIRSEAHARANEVEAVLAQQAARRSTRR